MASYVGIDLHRRRSVIVVLDEAGDRVWSSRIENSRLNLEVELRSIIEKVEGPTHVIIEATWGWYWAADVVEEVGLEMHLAHPLATRGYETRRVKTDWLDAELLLDLWGPEIVSCLVRRRVGTR